MDRTLDKNQIIYQIYRSCRLCGAGAGYKMPIIQNVVDPDGSEVELKQKIRECLQLEVHQNDKMPPLICELCVDKVNDFYEFLELCRKTYKKTRKKLGLPMQSVSHGSLSIESGDCILGLSEPVYINEDSDGEPLAKQKNKSKNTKKIKHEVAVKKEDQPRDTRSSGYRPQRHQRVSPPRVTRTSRSSGHSDDDALISSRGHGSKTTPKSILKRGKDVIKNENESLTSSRLKRTRDKDTSKPEVPVKKVKIAIKNAVSTSKSSPKLSPQSRRAPRPRRAPSPPLAPSPAPSYPCSICHQVNKTAQGNSHHMRCHVVTYTNHKLACNACGMWFTTSEEAATHHRRHRNNNKPYICPRCSARIKQQHSFDKHYNKNDCIPSVEVPDIKCEVCWRFYPTNNLYEDHKCGGEDSRPGGKCNKCNRNYALLKNLKKHESSCTAKKKGELNVDPAVMKSMRPLKVRVARCDPLLSNVNKGHVDVSNVHHEYGLDRNYVYPYIYNSSFRIKSEYSINLNGMVNIGDGIKEEFCSAAFVHWDSEDESDSDTEISFGNRKPIESLSALTLKTIFSQKCLGKVPRRRRRVKMEKFDMSTDLDISKSITCIIDNLGNDDIVMTSDDSGKAKGDFSIDFDNLIGDKEVAGENDASAVSFDDVLKDDAKVSESASFDDLLKNDNDTVIETKNDDHQGVEEMKTDDGTKTDSFDDLLKNDDKVSETKNDGQKMETNDAPKADTIVDSLKNDEDKVNETKNDGHHDGEKIETNDAPKADSFDDSLKIDDEIVKGDEIEKEDDANKNDASNFDNLGQVTKTNDDHTDKVDDVETSKVHNEMESDTPNDGIVELSNHDVGKGEVTTEIKENSEVVNNISNEQNNVVGVNDKVLNTEDISEDIKEIKPNETVDKVAFECEAKETDVKKIDISENNTRLETYNVVPEVTEVKDCTPSNNIDKDFHKKCDEPIDINQVQKDDPSSARVQEDADLKSNELNNLEDISDTEMDDTKLMEALDAQIGESNSQVNDIKSNKENNRQDSQINELNHVDYTSVNTGETVDTSEKTESSNNMSNIDNTRAKIKDTTDKYENDQDINSDVKLNDKITLNDLITTSDNSNLKSLDLDSISDDDFNFDV